MRRFAGAALVLLAGIILVSAGLAAKQQAPGGRGRLAEYVVQFQGPVLERWKAAITAEGADIHEYLPNFAFRVRMAPPDAARVRQLPFVAAVTPFQPANKFARRLARNGRRPYVVRLERGADVNAVKAALAATGAQVLRRGGSLLTIAADSAQLDLLAQVDGLAGVEDYVPRIKHNEFGGGVIMGSNAANLGGFDGSSQTIAIADTGLGNGTAAGAHAGIAAARVSSIFNWPGTPDVCFDTIVDDGAADVDTGHGTHVATAALGAGNLLGVGRGTAPAANLVFQSIENYAIPSLLCSLIYGLPEGYYLVGVPADLGDLFQQGYNTGARVHSDSWGSEVGGEYTADSESTDAFVWSHRDMAITFSAGNSGFDLDADGVVDATSINSPATAKNVITVGASENDRQSHWGCDPSLGYTTCAAQGGMNDIFTYGAAWPDRYPANPLKDDPSAGNAEQMAAFSSRGPTVDGRIKPDVVAPGTWNLSGYSDKFQQQYDASPNPRNGLYQYDGWGFPADQDYKYMGGTSMAAPLVAGGAAVVRDFYVKHHGHQATAALVKATLINSAVDLLDENNDGLFDNANPIPNIHEGWGRVDLARATDGSHLFDDETTPLATGSSATFTFDVSNPGLPFKATVAWTDYPSSASATVNLVNDLDLTVVAPDGTTYRGNAFAGGWSVAGGAPDRLNNVENVYVFAAQAGTWSVTVSGYNVPVGPQPFALVVDTGSQGGSTLPIVRVSAADNTATEAGLSSGAIRVSRSGETAASLTVFYAVTGTATPGSDYVALTGSVTIPEGASEALVPVDPQDDELIETTETVIATLAPDAAYTIGSPASAVVSITSDDLPPDLVVTAVTGPTAAAAGSVVNVTDTTKNQGTANAPASETGFYLSANTVWDASDTFIGSRPVSPLAPGIAELATTPLEIPAATVAGRYYVLARADWSGDIGETNETNNTRASAQLKVGPDLMVSVLTVPATAAAGDTVQVTDTSNNSGAGASGPSVTAFYLSSNGSLDAGDVRLGDRPVPALDPGAIDTATTSLTIPVATTVGSYYVLAHADANATVAESLETNNLKASAVIRIGIDLTVSALTAPATAGAGRDLVVAETTLDIGGADSPASTTLFYLSANAVLDGSDLLLGSRPVPPLDAGAADATTITLALPPATASGTYYLLAKADGPLAIAETNENNNVKASAPVKVGIDLGVTVFTAPASAGAGDVIAASDTTRNSGGGDSPASTTYFYLSTTTSLDATDILLGSRPVPLLAAGASDAAITPLTIPAGTPPGSYYFIAKADGPGAVTETSETNNLKASALVKIGPDLTVSALVAPSLGGAGETISLTDTTKNLGGGPSPPTDTAFYLSTNTALDAADLLLGTRPVPMLTAGATSSGLVSLVVPASVAMGSYYVIAKADQGAVVAELLEGNNVKASTVVKIGPDLIVSALAGPASAVRGATIVVTDTTRNQGGGAADPTSTTFYLSANSLLDATDVAVGSRAVDWLGAGASLAGATSLTIPATMTTGTYYLIAKADAAGAIEETSELNNTRVMALRVNP
ncbi:MAG: CARDB domain-containing protein [Vicinamibacterales bacterium]